MRTTVQFREREMRVEVARREGGQIRITLHDDADEREDVYLIATKFIPQEVHDAYDEITPDAPIAYIKDYSENEGVLEALASAGIIAPTMFTVEAGYTYLVVAYVNPELI